MGELPGKESVISALFPSSAWEHTFAKLRFAIHHGKQTSGKCVTKQTLVTRKNWL
jgi:hypothetical protein